MDYLNRGKVYEEISYNIELLKQNIKNIKIQSFNQSSKTYKLITKIEKEVSLVSKSIEELKRPFLLFVIGPGKYGKSTIINSLLEDNILETKDIPNTWKLDLLIKSKERKMEIVYDNDKIQNFSHEKGKEILINEEVKVKKSKLFIKNEFQKYKNDKSKKIEELKKHKKVLDDRYLYRSNISEVRYYINKRGILNDFIIVDTPGLNQTLLKYTKKRMIDYYKRADGVIWILDSQNIVSKSSSDLLSELKENYVIDNRNNNIICVVNKIDIIKNKKEDLCKVREKISQLYSNYFKDIVLVSAKEAINGYIKNNEELIESSNIEALKDSIDINFKKYSQDMQIRSKYKNFKFMSDNIIKEIDDYKRNLYCDMYKFDEAKILLDKEINKVKSYLLNHINAYICFDNLIDKFIKVEVKTLESVIISEINKLYIYLNNISTFDDDYSESKLNLLFNISKIKEIEILEKLIVEYKVSCNKDSINLNIINCKRKNEKNKYNLKNSINLLRDIINTNLLSYLLELENIINNKRERSFRSKYTDFELIKNHLVYINNINSVLKNGVDDNG
jgi:GTPase Era involved in 16S rRNA processing